MLKRSKDRKVATSATPSAAVRVANTFGLPNGKAFSCVGQTAECAKVCYAGRLEKAYTNVSNVLQANWQALQGLTLDETISLLTDMLSDFVRDCERTGAPKMFRIHWDGDFFDLSYTLAWARVIAAFGDVQFWVYTRNGKAAMVLHKKALPNLALYFSADAENIGMAQSLRRQGIRLAVMGDTFAHAQELNGSRKAARCPEQTGQIDLITPEGGACYRCGLCVHGKADILFSVTKR